MHLQRGCGRRWRAALRRRHASSAEGEQERARRLPAWQTLIRQPARACAAGGRCARDPRKAAQRSSGAGCAGEGWVCRDKRISGVPPRLLFRSARRTKLGHVVESRVATVVIASARNGEEGRCCNREGFVRVARTGRRTPAEPQTRTHRGKGRARRLPRPASPWRPPPPGRKPAAHATVSCCARRRAARSERTRVRPPFCSAA